MQLGLLFSKETIRIEGVRLTFRRQVDRTSTVAPSAVDLRVRGGPGTLPRTRALLFSQKSLISCMSLLGKDDGLLNICCCAFM